MGGAVLSVWLIQQVFAKQRILLSRIGVERSRQVLKESGPDLLVLNYSEELSEEDVKLFEAVEGMDVIVILNKTDLEAKIDTERVRELRHRTSSCYDISFKEEGINDLKKRFNHCSTRLLKAVI